MIAIQPGTIADYDALAHHHYRAGRPATVVYVLAARHLKRQQPVGVLVVSMPAIDGPWRAAAWPGRYSPSPIDRTGEARAARLRAVNADIRVISRVVVDPRFRARGLARQLVRAYLDRPLTIRTEAVAAMGTICRFFQSAGMTAVPYPPARRVIRLRTRLLQLGIQPWRLVDGESLLRDCRAPRRRELHRALRIFANAHRDTRACADAPLDELIAIAARRVACEPCAFVHSTA